MWPPAATPASRLARHSASGHRSALSSAPAAASTLSNVQPYAQLDEIVAGGGAELSAGANGRPTAGANGRTAAEEDAAAEEHEEDAAHGCGHYGHAGMVEAAERVAGLLHASGLLPALLESQGLDDPDEAPAAATRGHGHAPSQSAAAFSRSEGGQQAERAQGSVCNGRDRVYSMLQMGEEHVYVSEDILGVNGGGGRCKGFDLVVVGHSLGAGVATLVSMLLKVCRSVVRVPGFGLQR